MALRRVVSPNQFFRTTTANLKDVYSSPTVTPNTKGSTTLTRTTPEATSNVNPYNFTAGQLANGFQSLSMTGQQYPWLHEAPTQYMPQTQEEADFDQRFGMLGSLIGPKIRQALATPIVHRDPISGSVSGDNGSVDYNVSIDPALGEKQQTYGTPEYFRKIYRDMTPTNNPAGLFGAQVARNVLHLSPQVAEVPQVSYGYNSDDYDYATGTPGTSGMGYPSPKDLVNYYSNLNKYGSSGSSVSYSDPYTGATDSIYNPYNKGNEFSRYNDPIANAINNSDPATTGGYQYIKDGTGSYISPVVTITGTYKKPSTAYSNNAWSTYRNSSSSSWGFGSYSKAGRF